MKFSNNHKATVAGLIVAIANVWYNIDWSNFVWSKEWPEFVLSGLVAGGGYLSTMNPMFTGKSKGQKQEHPEETK